ncbi:hypothetical protein C8Q78DRAFT_1056268 [Trametes maxima]|nr:hypothetical protein C8Q78DRAFT_1056268 [Trametes maxima]
MRTRRRPVLQDKTPVNTPQKPRASAKPKLVPVVEIKARSRRAGKSKGKDVEEVDAMDTGHPQESQTTLQQADTTRVYRTARAGRGKKKQATDIGQRAFGRTNPNPSVNGKREEELSSTLNANGVASSSREVEIATEESHNPPKPATGLGAAAGPLRHISLPPSPTAGRQPLAVRHVEPIPPAPQPVPQRYSTPNTIPIADDDSSPSDAVKAIFDTPSPTRIIRAPIPVQSTPLAGKLEQKFSPMPAARPRGRLESSIRRWNHGVSRAYSPLPPSSPPPPSPPTQEPIAGSSRALPQPYRNSDFDMQEAPPRGPIYVAKVQVSDDDPFGLLAAERNLKAMRERRAKVKSSRAPGARRAPLGTLALDEVPSDVPIPDHLPTPLPSDDDHNIDDLYLDVDPVRSDIPRTMHVDEEMEVDEELGDIEDDDKENVPTADYDLDEDKENLRPPHLAFSNHKENGPLHDNSSDVDEENMLPLDLEADENGDISLPPLLVASAKRGLDELFAPSSSSASPTHALRTPHKHRSAHKRTPLPTPHFSDDGFSDSPLTAKSAGRRDSSPSPVKPASRHVARAKAGPSVARRPLATIDVEMEDEPEAEPEVQESPTVAARKRTRAQAVPSEDDSDPRAAVRKLESMLPKRSKMRARSSATARGGMAVGRGRGRGRGGGRGRGRPAAVNGKGKARADPVDGETNSEESNAESDTSPPKAKIARTARGSGRGRGTSRGRARGRSAAPISTSSRPESKRGRPTSKGKGKERAVEEVDPDEDEERARRRQERIEYFRKLQEYSIEKEDVYVI